MTEKNIFPLFLCAAPSRAGLPNATVRGCCSDHAIQPSVCHSMFEGGPCSLKLLTLKKKKNNPDVTWRMCSVCQLELAAENDNDNGDIAMAVRWQMTIDVMTMTVAININFWNPIDSPMSRPL